MPGPVIFGAIIDKTCLIWEEKCDGARTCWMYDNNQLSTSAFLMLLALRLGSIVFLIATLWSYKPSLDANDEEDEESVVKKKEEQ